MLDNKGQTSAEFILLIGGIIVVVLLTLMFYRNYISCLIAVIMWIAIARIHRKGVEKWKVKDLKH